MVRWWLFKGELGIGKGVAAHVMSEQKLKGDEGKNHAATQGKSVQSPDWKVSKPWGGNMHDILVVKVQQNPMCLGQGEGGGSCRRRDLGSLWESTLRG